jgi:hypothetical protein
VVVYLLHAEEAAIPTRILRLLQPTIGRFVTQVEITLKTMGFWQRVLEGETYVTGSLVPLAIYTIRQSFLQVIPSQANEQVVKELTRIVLHDFDRRYHPTTNGQLKYERDALVGHGNRYISIPAAFLDHSGTINKEIMPTQL